MPAKTDYSYSKKSILEAQKRVESNNLYEELRILLNCAKISKESTLARAVEFLTGQPFAPDGPTSGPGPIKKSAKEQMRRDRISAGIEALKMFILDNKLGTDKQRLKLEHNTVLDIICRHIKSISRSSSTSDSGISSSLSTLPTSKTPVPVPSAVLQLFPDHRYGLDFTYTWAPPEPAPSRSIFDYPNYPEIPVEYPPIRKRALLPRGNITDRLRLRAMANTSKIRFYEDDRFGHAESFFNPEIMGDLPQKVKKVPSSIDLYKTYLVWKYGEKVDLKRAEWSYKKWWSPSARLKWSILKTRLKGEQKKQIGEGWIQLA
ncbi:unnamed protein product [Caenorhabditis sp. 36 PRJEB53466]|nr:unnamed protein product [Caenorhabditis sp. 36 PRJEB53466]